MISHFVTLAHLQRISRVMGPELFIFVKLQGNG